MTTDRDTDEPMEPWSGGHAPSSAAGRTLPNRRFPAVPEQPRTQVERVAARFGGIPRLYAALNRLPDPAMRYSKPQLYRWNYPRSRGGCDGVIPTPALRAVLTAARWEGIVLTPFDLYGGME